MLSSYRSIFIISQATYSSVFTPEALTLNDPSYNIHNGFSLWRSQEQPEVTDCLMCNPLLPRETLYSGPDRLTKSKLLLQGLISSSDSIFHVLFFLNFLLANQTISSLTWQLKPLSETYKRLYYLLSIFINWNEIYYLQSRVTNQENGFLAQILAGALSWHVTPDT